MDEKLKKALECCKNNDMCPECPLIPELYCREILTAEAENYIAELEERLAITQESMEALEQRCKALEKRNEPIEPIVVPIGEDVSVPFIRYKCPKCDMFQIEFKPNYCSYCGQAVKWHESDD